MSELLTVAEVARLFHVDEMTVRRWAKLGALEARVLPSLNGRQKFRFKREVVEHVLTPKVLSS